ncbi:hypothetical protein ACOME3_006691 [Neoechinorhynchus agilis]
MYKKSIFHKTINRFLYRHHRSTASKSNEVTSIVRAFPVFRSLDFPRLRRDLIQLSLPSYQPVNVPDLAPFTVCITSCSEALKDFFLLNNGVLVAWNCSEQDCESICRFLLNQYVSNLRFDFYDASLSAQEREEIEFVESESKPSMDMRNHCIKLNRPHEHEQRFLNQYPFTDRLAASVKLAMYENDFTNESSILIPKCHRQLRQQSLRESRDCSVKEVLGHTSSMLTIRHNLADLSLDISDFYWDRPESERLFNVTNRYFSISERARALNVRTEHCLSILGLVKSLHDDWKHTRLEFCIIVLIAADLIVSILNKKFP